MKFYPAMNRNLAQRKSTVLAADSMITPHQPFCLDQGGATANAGFRTPASPLFSGQKLFLEFLAPELHWIG